MDMKHFEELPEALEELQALKRWVGYRLKKDEGKQKYKKVPVDPATGQNASITSSAQWGKYDMAVAAVTAYDLDGIGFVFYPSDGYVGIDIDHAVDTDGRLNDFGADIVDCIDSYTEYSPSGTGVHIIARIQGDKKIGNRDGELGIEIYNSGRFFTISGKIYGSEKRIKDRTHEVQEFHDKYFKKMDPETPERRLKMPAEPALPLDDSEVWKKAIRSRKGSEIQALRDGDLTGYGGDHSRADQALINHLVYWTDGDAGQADRMFRNSGLMRPKWDEVHGNKTYGQMTIEKALENYEPRVDCTGATDSHAYGQESDKVCQFPQPVGSNQEGERKNKEMLHGNENNNKEEGILKMTERIKEETQEQFMEHANEQGLQKASEASNVNDGTRNTSDKSDITPVLTEAQKRMLNDNVRVYWSKSGSFLKELAEAKKYSNRKIGFKSVDEHLGGLNPGLYALTGDSGVGKTTFMLNVDMNLAESGEYVLYFSMEQSKLDLTCKCMCCAICRQVIKKDFKGAVSVKGMKCGRVTKALKDIQKDFVKTAKNMSFICGDFDTDIDTIKDYIKDWIALNGGRKPVVIIDYLQIIRPKDNNKSTKEAVDDNMRELKLLQKEYDLTIFVICSMNRGGYGESLGFEAIKESGGIEYTADFVCGLQLAVVTSDDYKDASKPDKKEMVKQAMSQRPREVEFVCLKNRYGEANFSCKLWYYSPFDCYFDDEDLHPALTSSIRFWDYPEDNDGYEQVELSEIPFDEDQDENKAG